MKGEHYGGCIKVFPTCLCNTCKHDCWPNYEALCCEQVASDCPVENCPDYEPDDEEDDDA